MSGLYLAHVRARWDASSGSYESDDGRGTRSYTNFHFRVEVLDSFAGTDGKLNYWLKEEPVESGQSGQVREKVLAAGLQSSVYPADYLSKVTCPAVGQILWNGRLTEELSQATWSFGDFMPKPTGCQKWDAYHRTWLVRWQTHGAYPGRAELFSGEAQSEFQLGRNWEWTCTQPLPYDGKRVEGLVQLPPKPEAADEAKPGFVTPFANL